MKTIPVRRVGQMFIYYFLEEEEEGTQESESSCD